MHATDQTTTVVASPALAPPKPKIPVPSDAPASSATISLPTGAVETALTEALPVPDQSLDVITIAFGLRNVTDIPKALAEASRALKPGGQFLCLEFSQVVVPLLARLYDSYSFHLIPWIGELVASDRASYQYLVESIRMFLKQEALKTMMEQAGLRDVTYENLTFGVAAIHRGWK